MVGLQLILSISMVKVHVKFWPHILICQSSIVHVIKHVLHEKVDQVVMVALVAVDESVTQNGLFSPLHAIPDLNVPV